MPQQVTIDEDTKAIATNERFAFAMRSAALAGLENIPRVTETPSEGVLPFVPGSESAAPPPRTQDHRPSLRAQMEKIRAKQFKEASAAAREDIILRRAIASQQRKTPPVNHFTVLDLTDTTCRYPVNDGGPYLFCGRESVPGSPYCRGCVQVVYGR